MKASYNDEQRFEDVRSGKRTGVPIEAVTGVPVYENNWAANETLALNFWCGVRTGCPWWTLEQTTIDQMLALTEKWLGDTRCPDCDHYWRSGNPQNTVCFVKYEDAMGHITVERCPRCGNMATETVELPKWGEF